MVPDHGDSLELVTQGVELWSSAAMEEKLVGGRSIELGECVATKKYSSVGREWGFPGRECGLSPVTDLSAFRKISQGDDRRVHGTGQGHLRT